MLIDLTEEPVKIDVIDVSPYWILAWLYMRLSVFWLNHWIKPLEYRHFICYRYIFLELEIFGLHWQKRGSSNTFFCIPLKKYNHTFLCWHAGE